MLVGIVAAVVFQDSDLCGFADKVPYLVKLLDQKEIPYIKGGNRRKIYALDVFSYRQKRDANRRSILREFSLGIKEDGLYDLDSVIPQLDCSIISPSPEHCG